MFDKILTLLMGYWEIVPLTITVVIMIAITYITSQIIGEIIKFFLPKRLDVSLRNFIPALIKVIAFIFGGICILSFSGISMTAITAMLGFSTIALGMSLKDLFVDLTHGVMILLSHPIKAGDMISIEGSTGVVLQIELMHTRIDCDGEIKLVPNTLIFTKIVGVRKN